MADTKRSASVSARRSLLKKVGTTGLLAISGISGSVNAREGKKASKRWKGIRNQIRVAHRKDGVEGVERVMNKNGLDYDLSVASPVVEFEEKDRQVGTQQAYSEGDSELLVLLNSVYGYDDRVRITSQMHLDNAVYSQSAAWHVPDVIGITFDSDHWTVVGTPYVTTDGTHEANWHSGSYNNGLVGDVNLETKYQGPYPYLPDSAIVTLESEVEHDGGALGSLWGHYDHTVSPTGFSSLNVEVSVGALNVGVSLGGSTKWSVAKPVDPATVL